MKKALQKISGYLVISKLQHTKVFKYEETIRLKSGDFFNNVKYVEMNAMRLSEIEKLSII